jgi:hypothetical protein
VIYLKCTLAGLAALVVSFTILAIPAAIIVFVLGLGVDIPHWHLASPVFWVSALVIFGVGFFWRLRRLTK